MARPPFIFFLVLWIGLLCGLLVCLQHYAPCLRFKSASAAATNSATTNTFDNTSSSPSLHSLLQLPFDLPAVLRSAVISPTYDNSTYFLARPAAFGSSLPAEGVTGQLWVGKGFRYNEYRDQQQQKYNYDEDLDLPVEPDYDGELGCSDVDIDSDATTREDLSGKVILLSRGACGFVDKIQWAQSRGGIAVIVGDNMYGNPLVTMYATGDVSNITIPALFTSYTSAHVLCSLAHADTLTESADATTSPSHHHHKNGLWVTLKATPVSFFVFSNTVLTLFFFTLALVFAFWVYMRAYAYARYRYWRTPKSVVDRLPVHTYLAVPSGDSSTCNISTPNPDQSSPETPLLQRGITAAVSKSVSDARVTEPISWDQAVSELEVEYQFRTSHQHQQPGSSSTSGHAPPQRTISSDQISLTESEKREIGTTRWRLKYGARQRECAICLEDYIDGFSRIMRLPCGHDFHVDCITPWLTDCRRTCPICKRDILKSLVRSEKVAAAAARAARINRAQSLPSPSSSSDDTDLESGLVQPSPERHGRRSLTDEMNNGFIDENGYRVSWIRRFWTRLFGPGRRLRRAISRTGLS